MWVALLVTGLFRDHAAADQASPAAIGGLCELAAVHERILQQQTVDAEVEKLNAGASTSYLVIQYQGDLSQAQSAEISAQSDYIKAETALERALGALLDIHHVSLSDAVKGDSSR